MATDFIVRQGHTFEFERYVGKKGEFTFNIDNNAIAIHNGKTPGGEVLLKAKDLPQQNAGMQISKLVDEDLNDIKTDGWYIQVDDAKALKTINYPEELKCTVNVTKLTDKDVIQVVRTHKTNNVYSRSLVNDVWGVWKVVPTEVDLKALEDKITTATGASTGNEVKDLADKDLNTVTESGTYIQTVPEKAKTAMHYPPNGVGILKVDALGKDAGLFVVQRYMSKTGLVFKRVYVDGNWGNWDGDVSMSQLSSIDTKVNELSRTVDDHKSKIVKNGLQFRLLIDCEKSLPAYFMLGVDFEDNICIFGCKYRTIVNNGQPEDSQGIMFIPNPLKGISKITSVYADVCSLYILYENKELYGVGRQSSGSFGIGNYSNQYTPVKITDNVVSVGLCSAGGDLTYGTMSLVKEDGSVWGAGSNSKGGLGTSVSVPPTILSQSTFTADLLSTDKPAATFVSGKKYTSGYVLTDTGKLFASGYNHVGQLGLGNTTDINKYTQVKGLLENKKVTQVVTNGCVKLDTTLYYETSIMVLTEDKEVYGWGNNSYGELGLGDTTNRNVPVKNDFLSSKNVKKLYGDRGSTAPYFALCENGDVYTWGSNKYGALGINNSDLDTPVSTPTKVDVPYKIKDIFILHGSISVYTTVYFITENNEIYVSGFNAYGQIGNNTLSNESFKPKKMYLKIKNNENIEQISGGGNNNGTTVYIRTSNNNVYGTGYNNFYNVLFNNICPYVKVPTMVM